MILKHFLLIHSAIYAFFALALFIIPEQLWPLYGLNIQDNSARFLSQHNSIFLAGLAITGFLFRNISPLSQESRSLLNALASTNILGMVITLYAAATGVFTGFGWSDPLFFAFLAALCFWQRNSQKHIQKMA